MMLSLQARVVFPVDRPPIDRGVVTIEGERIVAVGNGPVGGEVIDLGSVALLPGLVNAHTHLEFSYLRQPLGKPGISLVDWIRLVLAERGRRDDTPAPAIEDGIRESLGHGVTSIGDITTADEPAHLGARMDLTLFAEVIGFSLARVESALSAIMAHLEMQQKLKTHGGRTNGELQFGVSPHAPYTVSPDLLQRLVELARERGLPVAMHVAESREELELLDVGSGPFRDLLEERSMWDPNAIPRGSRPLHYLRLLSHAPRSLVIHGNYLEDDELEFLGANRKRMSLVCCPRTHAYFGHPPYPLAKAIAAGARVALGTDSRASNPDLDLLAEMRHIVRAHASLDPQQVLRMGTLDGAEALGRDHEVGSITIGKLANIIAIPVPGDSPAAPDDILAAIFANEAAPSSVHLAGSQL